MSLDNIEEAPIDTFDGGIAPEADLETAAQREDEVAERLEDTPVERDEAREEGKAEAADE